MQDMLGAAGRPDWPDAVVFDLDGTLIDSAPDIAGALNEALARRDLPPFPIERVKQMIGGGIPKLVERALLAHGVSRIALMSLAGDFIEIYRGRLVAETRLFEGAAEMLDGLRARGKRLGICTNKQHELTVEALQQLGLADYFAAVIGERLGKPKKPDPAPLRGVLMALGVAPERAVMVGDSAADVGCARAAGVSSIVVSHGYSTTPARELGADAVIDSFAEFDAALSSLVPTR